MFAFFHLVLQLQEKLLQACNVFFCIFCRIIEIAGGREVFSQSRVKVSARKSRFLAASNSINNEDIQTDNKLSVKKNNKSPSTQTIWELRSR